MGHTPKNLLTRMERRLKHSVPSEAFGSNSNAAGSMNAVNAHGRSVRIEKGRARRRSPRHVVGPCGRPRHSNAVASRGTQRHRGVAGPVTSPDVGKGPGDALRATTAFRKIRWWSASSVFVLPRRQKCRLVRRPPFLL